MSSHVIDQLAQDWRNAGVQEGDLLLVHSDVKRTFRRISKMGGAIDPALVLQSFLQALGPSGTLVLPCFNFDFPKGTPFDIRTSPSQMGTFTETGRTWPEATRTGHPIYSFAAIGGRADLFGDVTNFSGYGSDSPFGILHRNGGKIAVLDLPDQKSMTFYHYVEESLEVSYRYHKTFTGDYTDREGNCTARTFGLFVRDIERGVQTHVDPMGEILWEKKLYSGFRPGEESGLRVIHAPSLFEEVSAVITGGRAEGTLYEIR